MAKEHESGQEHRLFEPSKYIKADGKVHEAECEDQDKLLVAENDAARDLQSVGGGKTSSFTGETPQSKEEDYEKQTRTQDTLTWSENLQLSRQEKLTERQSKLSMESSQELNYPSIEKQKVATGDESDTTRTDSQRQKMQTSNQQCEGESKVANISDDESQYPECQASMDSQTSLNSSDQPLDADNKVLDSLDRSTCLHSQADCLQSTDQSHSKVGNESQSSTKYLDSVISCIQSLSDNQSEAKRDNVQISRAEFALMVEQTLKAQTMCSYIQQLAQNNQMLKKEIMKQTMMAWQSVRDEAETQNLPSETQIFRFDRCPLPPVSLPHRMPCHSASCSQTPADYCYPSQPSQVSGPQSAGHEYPTGFLQADGDSMSDSFQLPSRLSLDGVSLHSGMGGREASASGTALLLPTTSDAAAASTVTGAPGPTFNIPNSDLLYGEHNYSMLQHNEEHIAGNAGVSPEQCALMEEELMKSKLFVFKICKDGGFHPEILKELVSYKNEVKSLQEENRRLKFDLENVRTQASAHEENNRELQTEIKAKNEKFQMQKKVQDLLIDQVKKLGQENKALKSDPHTRKSINQLPSSEGAPVLPTSRSSDECQTEVERQDRLTQTEEQAYQLQQEAERAHSMLTAAKRELSNLQHRLEERTVRCTKLDEERNMFSKQNDQLKKRCDYMELKLKEERKRWSRDEKHMIEQFKEDAKIMNRLESLVLALDTALTEGKPLQRCHVDHLTALRKGNKLSVPRITLTNSARSENPLAGSLRSSTNSGHLPPQNPHCPTTMSSPGSGAHGACAPLYQGNSRRGYNIGPYEHNPQSGMNRSSAVPASRPTASEMQRQYASLHPGGNTVLSSQAERPLQRNNMGGSAPAMSSTSDAGSSKFWQQ